jgi:protein-disulfide isomerase
VILSRVPTESAAAPARGSCGARSTVSNWKHPMSKKSKTPATSSLVVPAVALVAALALGGVLLLGGGAEGDPDPQAASADRTAPAEDSERSEVLDLLERRQEGDPLALGDVDAPVLMIEWADFQCPFCGSFARDTKPELMERYVDEGILRIEWRDFPVLGPESQTAALAGRAAAEQDAFWDLHDEIYAEERERNAGELAEESLLAMVDDLGLDVDRFADDLGDPAHEEAIELDLQIAQQLGITGTPAFLVNGQLMIGGQPTEMFARAVEQAAEEADA